MARMMADVRPLERQRQASGLRRRLSRAPSHRRVSRTLPCAPQVERREQRKQELQDKFGISEVDLRSRMRLLQGRLLTYNRSLTEAFRKIDTNKDNYVSVTELTQFFRNAHLDNVPAHPWRGAEGRCAHLRDAIREPSVAADALHESLPETLLPRRQVMTHQALTALLSFVDADGDGQYDLNELAKVCFLKVFCIFTNSRDYNNVTYYELAKVCRHARRRPRRINGAAPPHA